MSALNRSIALAGAGAIGIPIIRALLNRPNHPKVVVLTRPGSKKDLPSDLSSATVIPVDYTDVAALTALFKEHNIEVVISAVSPPGYVTTQHALADAAKASGSVKLFVPSEWGVPTEGAKGEDNLFSVKDELAEYLKSIGLPYTRFFTGLFMGFIPWVTGGDVDSSNVYIQGTGKTPFTTTSEEDIGGFVAHVLTSLPLTSPDLVNASLRIQGQKITLQECARFLNKSIVLVAEGESIPAKTDEEKHFKALVQTQIEGGMASTGWDRRTNREIEGAAGSANKLWEGHVWQTVGSSST
ncbi:hypothetical protein F5050DRAFT_1570180 [Lentinula boryana]|uniref:NmrA-like domain-containing protein n=1 Tax=Lentinula boryana TaxID=40481 RepID=A0ABQ8QEV3_9AGAR|nr:hypothetical protein F5050DRAFT_1570180 [Lentinula boryana]